MNDLRKYDIALEYAILDVEASCSDSVMFESEGDSKTLGERVKEMWAAFKKWLAELTDKLMKVFKTKDAKEAVANAEENAKIVQAENPDEKIEVIDDKEYERLMNLTSKQLKDLRKRINEGKPVTPGEIAAVMDEFYSRKMKFLNITKKLSIAGAVSNAIGSIASLGSAKFVQSMINDGEADLKNPEKTDQWKDSVREANKEFSKLKNISNVAASSGAVITAAWTAAAIKLNKEIKSAQAKDYMESLKLIKEINKRGEAITNKQLRKMV